MGLTTQRVSPSKRGCAAVSESSLDDNRFRLRGVAPVAPSGWWKKPRVRPWRGGARVRDSTAASLATTLAQRLHAAAQRTTSAAVGRQAKTGDSASSGRDLPWSPPTRSPL
ncbi:hypothetical protein U9M48_041795 [Paspalum notatum var. saurae]|uniref:Uncharacterized protein n=1 Tax=Paspalum notatum var. saurae TaxID=547442 RepID=A0AAQ3UPK6_PASNO